MIFELVDWVGIFGSLVIAGAYFGVSNEYLRSNQATYHLLNLIGSIFILYSLFFTPNAGAIFVEILWLLIAIFALIKIITR